jgi:hypothetical protein
MEKHDPLVHPLIVPKSQNCFADTAVNETGLKAPSVGLFAGLVVVVGLELVGPVVVVLYPPVPGFPGLIGETYIPPHVCSCIEEAEDDGYAVNEPLPDGTVATRLLVPAELPGSVTATE